MNLLLQRTTGCLVAAVISGILLVSGCRRDTDGPEPSAPEVGVPRIAVPSPAVEPMPLQEFFDAALEGKLETVGQGIARGTDVNMRDEGGRTALMLAAFNGHAEVIARLIDAGANVRMKEGSGRTPLMFAATGPDLAAIRLLLERGARVNEVDGGERWTPLMFAAAEGHVEVVQALLKAGADPAMQDVDGDTARDFALQRGHTAVADLLKTEK